MKKKKKKLKLRKPRDLNAIAAHFRTGAGPIKDKKKESSKKACRGKKDYE